MQVDLDAKVKFYFTLLESQKNCQQAFLLTVFVTQF